MSLQDTLAVPKMPEILIWQGLGLYSANPNYQLSIKLSRI